MSHRRVFSPRRRPPRAARVASAAAVAAALAALGGAGPAFAQLVTEPFSYPAGAALDGKINPSNGLPWSAMSASSADDDIVVSGSALTYPGLASSTGGSVTYGGTGKTERLSLGPAPLTSGTAYYSLLLSVTNLGGLGTTSAFVAGFSNGDGTSAFQPTTIGARLYLRQGATSTPQAPTFNVGVSKNSSTNTDIRFDTTELPVNTPVLLVGSYQIVGTGSGTDDVAKLYINPQASDFGAAAPPTAAVGSTRILTAPVTGTDLSDNGVPSLAGFLLRQGSSTVPGVQVDELRVDPTWAQVTPPTGTTWNVNADGNWSDDGNWSTAAAPNAAGAFVNFGSVATAARTITVTAPVSLRTINFASSVPYIVAGSQPLNFSDSGAINVIGPAGSHSVAAPVQISAGGFEANVGSGSSLALSGGVSGGSASPVSKTGAGLLTVTNIRAGALSIGQGEVRLQPDGTSGGTSNVASLTVAPGARLDLQDNDLVVAASPVGTWNGTAYTGVTGMLQSGRNDGSSGANWGGSGIVTSQPTAVGGDYTSLGVAQASDVLGISAGQTATWSGQTVSGSATLVRYTYGGDANLDGVINIDDYTQIDSSVSVGGALKGWYNGDFNYDGNVDIDDYTIIDSNIGVQGPSLGDGAPLAVTGAAPAAVTAVPEPAAVELAPLAMFAARRRRRRTHQ